MSNVNHAEKAKSLFESGYNCCQAVLCAYADELGLDNDRSVNMTSTEVFKCYGRGQNQCFRAEPFRTGK